MNQEPITIETTVYADIAQAWNCFTDPQHVVKWNHASDDWHCPHGTADVRTGGTFSFTMSAKDGSMSFDFGGVYDEVIPNKYIAYTMGDGRKVTVNFIDEGGTVRIIETFDPESENSRELQQAGWQAILDNYRRYVEGKGRY